MANVSEVTYAQYSGDFRVDALLDDGPAWNYLTGNPANTLYYTYDVHYGLSSGVYSNRVFRFNDDQITATETALEYISSITGINFVYTDGRQQAQLIFLQADIVSGTTSGLTDWSASWIYDSSYELTSYSATASIYLDVYDFGYINNVPSYGTDGYQVILHELGHALGLKHPFEGDYQLGFVDDNTANTLMSYTDAGGTYSSFQEYDLLTLDWIYGGDGLQGEFGLNSLYGSAISSPDYTIATNELTVLVDAGVLDSGPVIVNGVIERVEYLDSVKISHTLEAFSQEFDYQLVSSKILTVVRNGEFTQEYSEEIAESFPEYADISYTEAISLIGYSGIDQTLAFVAGADGSYVS